MISTLLVGKFEGASSPIACTFFFTGLASCPENLNIKTANTFVPGVGHELQISNYKGILTMYFKFGIICRDSARNSNWWRGEFLKCPKTLPVHKVLQACGFVKVIDAFSQKIHVLATGEFP